MSDVELLRKAAALMRERAEGATTSGRWHSEQAWFTDNDIWAVDNDGQPHLVARRASDENAEYIASWDPRVALTVAVLLDAIASAIERAPSFGTDPEAVTVARAYLREGES